MTPLLPEYTRCKPQIVSSQCENCKRWVDHPEQTFGNGIVHVLDRKSKSCFYIPVSLQEEL